jgi:hypothetical protein
VGATIGMVATCSRLPRLDITVGIFSLNRTASTLRRIVWLSALLVCGLSGPLVVPALAGGESAPVAPTPVSVEAPRLSGTPTVGKVLACSQGAWEGSPNSFAYTWLRDGRVIAGQAGSTYVVQAVDQGHVITCQVTASNSGGEYSIVGLPTGLYKVNFRPGSESGNFMAQSFVADPVSVTAGEATLGVSAAMVGGGQIAGRVTVPNDPSIAAEVDACAETEDRQEACAATNAVGEYTISGLPSGFYSIWFHTTTPTRRFWLWNGFYDGEPSREAADLVSVTAGSMTPGIDEEMQTGWIVGRITSADGGIAIDGVEVCATQVGDGSMGACATTNSTGEYVISVATGLYKLEFATEYRGREYVKQFYSGASSWSSATNVAVTTGNVTGGIDAELQPGGQITGEVTSASTHAPLVGITVCTSSPTESGPCATTDAAGRYTLSGLSTGSYRVAFSTEWGGPNYLSQYFNGKSTEAEETPVAVTAGSVTSGINAEMQRGGEITGMVTSAAMHMPVPGILACVEGGLGASECVPTNATGEYALTALPSGSAVVAFRRYPEGGNFLSGHYSGDPVSVAAGSVTSGINSELLAGGQITGRLTSETGGTVPDVTVCAQHLWGSSQSFNEQFWGGESECTITNKAGGSSSARGNTIAVPARHIDLAKVVFDRKTRTLDLYLKFGEAGSLRWKLSFKNSDTGFAYTASIAAKNVSDRAQTVKLRCRKGYTVHKHRCAVELVPFASGSERVEPGTVEIKARAGNQALNALSTGHRLHVGGDLTFQSALGGPVITRTMSTVVQTRKKRHAQGRRILRSE